MNGRETLIEAVELTLISGQLEGDQPGSLLITAEVEEGKTHLVSRYQHLPSVAYLADATAHGIITEYKERLLKGSLSHVIFPELIRPLARQKETASSLVAFLAELMEEGVKEIRTFATSFALPKPVKAGVIAAIAKGNLSNRVRYWNETGFLSRFLVMSYSYGEATAEEVRKSITLRRPDSRPNFVLPPRSSVALPPELGDRIATRSVGLAQGLYAPLHGFRMQKHLQRLAMASALRAGRKEVNESDLVPVGQIAQFVNLEYKEV